MISSDEATLREADQFIDELRRSINHGFSDVKTAKELLRTVLRRRMWADRIVNMTDRRQQYEDFMRFVQEPPLEGLGTTTDTLETLSKGDEELEDLLTHAMNKGRGGNNNPHGRTGKPDIEINHYNIMIDKNEAKAVQGVSREYALRRLRKDRPDLHERVIAGAISPHGAMVEAGFRKPTITVPLDTEAAAAAILRHFTPEQVADLIARLLSLRQP